MGVSGKPPERLPVPFTFKPQLTLRQAVAATFGAVLRIVLGSLLFAVWGGYSLVVWSAVHSVVFRFSVLILMLAAFVVAFRVLLRALDGLVRALSPSAR